MRTFNEEQWVNWVDALAEDDYVVIDDFLDIDTYHQIRQYFLQKLGHEAFDKAGIGALADHHIDRSERGDHVYWLDRKTDRAMENVFSLFDELIANLNRYCFLGIADFESHLAYYPEGTFYKKHVDQFKERSNRLISMVLYLNEDWQPEHGGTLKLYLNEGTKTLAPLGRRLVLFKSDVIPHEVLPTSLGRYSLTGWLLKNPADLGFLLG